MFVSILQIENIRSFKECIVRLSKGVNVFVGQNNAGKTTILRTLLALQQPPMDGSFMRHGCAQGSATISLLNIDKKYFEHKDIDSVTVRPGNGTLFLNISGGAKATHGAISPKEPDNFIYPHLAKRKVASYSENISLAASCAVTGNFSNLYAKIDRLSNPEFMPAYEQYIKACDDILGFRVSASASESGKKGVYIIKNSQQIAIDSMGEGIVNMLAMIADLCVAENQLFLIEEPENDIHPKALKKLLALIAERSISNQFVITTHSNIVVKHLGGVADAAIFNVSMDFEERVPTSSVDAVDTPDKRRSALEDLGYELYDFDVWSGWLFFEESSAERIVRDVLVPLFVPKLKVKIRTFSARCLDEVSPKFDDFNRLFVYLHLQPSYQNRAWVLVDGGDKEKKVIEQLREKYVSSGWSESCFKQLKEHDFEMYYPAEFQGEVGVVLGIQDKKERRDGKKELLEKIVAWCGEDESRARASLKVSAKEVIDILLNIEAHLA